jgi:protein-tyrosine phosphatase
MREVIADLYLGNALDARDLRRLYDLQIAAVVDLAVEEPPAQLGRELVYCRFPLSDGVGNPRWLIAAAIEATAMLLRQSVRSLVACSGGMSRSPAVVAMALSRVRGGEPANWLLEIVRNQPREVSPLLWRDVMECSAGDGP